MNKKINIWFYIIILILPLFLSVNLKFYFEFIAISLFIKYSTSFLLKNSKLDNNIYLIKDIIQLVYSLIILLVCSYSFTPENILDTSSLIGDSSRYYEEALNFESLNEDALSILQFRNYTTNNYFFYQVILSKIFPYFEYKILAGILFSAFIGIINFVLLNIIITKLTINKKINYYFSILYLISPHVIASSTYLYKDNLVVLAFILILYGVIEFTLDTSKLIKGFILIFTGLILTFAVRLPYIYLYISLSALIYWYCRKNNKFSFKSIILFCTLIILIFSLYSASNYSTDRLSGDSIFYDYDYHRSRLVEDSTLYGSGITSRLVGDYASSSKLKQFIYLPVVTFVQYMNPINIHQFNYENPWYFVEINCKIIWLFITGPLFLFTCLNFKVHNIFVKMLILISALGYIIIAHIQTGIVPRYALPFIVIALIPCAFNYPLLKHYLIKPKYRNFQLCYYVPFITVYIIFVVRDLI